MPVRLTRPPRRFAYAAPIAIGLVFLLMLALLGLAAFGWQVAHVQRSQQQEAQLKQLSAHISNRLLQLELTLRLLAPDNSPEALTLEQNANLLQAANGNRADIAWLAWQDSSGNIARSWPPGPNRHLADSTWPSSAARARQPSRMTIMPMPGAQPTPPK